MPVLLDLSAVSAILGLSCSRQLSSHSTVSFSGPPSVPRRGAAPPVSSACPLPTAVISPPLAEPQARPSDGQPHGHPKPGPARSLCPQAGGRSSAVVAAVLPGSPAGPGDSSGRPPPPFPFSVKVTPRPGVSPSQVSESRLLPAVAATWVRASTVAELWQAPCWPVCLCAQAPPVSQSCRQSDVSRM